MTTLPRLAAIATLSALAAAGGITTARAETATMSGVLGFRPNYAALDLCPCTTISHPTMPWSVPTIANRIEQWADTSAATPEPRTLATYSLSTVGAREYLERDDAKPLQVLAFGSPDTPRKDRDRKITAPEGTRLTYHVALYDPIADPMARWNLLAAMNSRLSTHLRGYDDLDLDNPDAIYEKDGVTTKYYAPETLPILQWRKGFTSPERMAELDARYRPRIEAAYDRPVRVPSPSEEDDEWNSEPLSSAESTRSASNADQSDEDGATAKPRTAAGLSDRTRKHTTRTTETTDAGADTSGSDTGEGEGE